MIETHCALIFLAGEEALKIKRAVKFDYLDFSTLSKRRAVCEHEFALNKPAATELYLGVVPIARDAQGALAIGGAGEPVEWAVRMRRFDQSKLYSNLADRRKIDTSMIKDLAAVLANYHKDAPSLPISEGTGRLAAIVSELRSVFAGLSQVLEPSQTDAFLRAADKHLREASPILDKRARRGLVRRCHGDLHLANIVHWNGQPCLFDALEFDEDLATTDLLYEVAFLVMDLWHRGLRAEANLLFNRYLFETDELAPLDGLCAFPLFMALRAAIRAMVCGQRAGLTAELSDESRHQAANYLSDAQRFLAPPQPRLVAVGGLSGTGKSTLAAEIAAHVGAAPGAVHIRSDLERKRLFGAKETERLGDACYTREASSRVYAAMLAKCGEVLAAGHSVIADAVFADQAWRQEFEHVAAEQGVPFTRLWLTAPENDLYRRVEARRGDASDASADTVRHQLGQAMDAPSWNVVDAGGSAFETLIAAEFVLRRDGALRFDETFARKRAAI